MDSAGYASAPSTTGCRPRPNQPLQPERPPVEPDVSTDDVAPTSQAFLRWIMAFSTLHYSEDGATIACSSPVDDTIARTAEPNDVNCTACILEMTGEYPSAEDYGSGYAHGKEKANFELRTWDGIPRRRLRM